MPSPDFIDHIVVALGFGSAAIAAFFSRQSNKKSRAIHEEVRSTNGSTTAQVVNHAAEVAVRTSGHIYDVEGEIADVKDIVLDVRERVVELTGMFASHTTDGHGGDVTRRTRY